MNHRRPRRQPGRPSHQQPERRPGRHPG
jgi:hypothetical protein